MITATINNNDIAFRVDFLVNRGGWFGQTWLVGIQCGFEQIILVVEGDNEGDLIDAIADSSRSYLITVDESDLMEGFENYAGNYGLPVNLDNVHIYGECKVNYFAKSE